MKNLRIKRAKIEAKKPKKVVSKIKAYIDGMASASDINKKKDKDDGKSKMSNNSLMGSSKLSSNNLPFPT